MSGEQDVLSAGWVDPRGGRRSETGATAVVPGQRSEGEPADPNVPVAESHAPVAEPNGSVAEPNVPVAGSNAPVAGSPARIPEPPVVGPPEVQRSPVEPAAERPGELPADLPATPYPTTPVNVGMRPRARVPRRDPLTRMGPWAPVAGAAIGLLLGVVVVLLLAPAVQTFDQRLALVFVVLGLSLLGAGGTLLADEVRLLRRGAQAAEARASGAGVIAGLLNGLTPARLLITASAFVLLLSAYVTSGS
jgi:hypothetical protein